MLLLAPAVGTLQVGHWAPICRLILPPGLEPALLRKSTVLEASVQFSSLFWACSALSCGICELPPEHTWPAVLPLFLPLVLKAGGHSVPPAGPMIRGNGHSCGLG